jgi:hypothetical protein
MPSCLAMPILGRCARTLLFLPTLTYAHLMPQEETDLSFADFGDPRRPYTAPVSDDAATNENTPDPSGRGRSSLLEHETGIEPATLTLARRCWG